MDRSAYLARIKYDGPVEPSPTVLRELQRQHLYSVPFENLSIHLGEPIHLDEDSLFDKIVRRKRGGFCYELNSLFARLLESIGYQVTLLNASGANDDGTYSVDFDHLALQVRCAGESQTLWLADVGWGDGFLEPLRITDSGQQQLGSRVYRIEQDNGYLLVVEQTLEGRWLKHYRFDLTPHTLEEYYSMCLYHQTSPESIFTQKRLCTIFTPEGRVTLSSGRLITICETGALRGSEEREERALSGEKEVREVLKTVFDVHLDYMIE